MDKGENKSQKNDHDKIKTGFRIHLFCSYKKRGGAESREDSLRLYVSTLK
jgi:hypothetical protein